MRKLKSIFLALSILFLASFLFGCAKEDGDYDYVNKQEPYNGNIYDYLKSKPGIFDSLLSVVERLNLADSLKTRKITLFAVTNESFKLASDRYNIPRIANGIKPIYLKDYDLSQLDSIMCRYIIRGVYPADSMTLTNGLVMRGLRYNYVMNGRRTIANANGQSQGGPTSITFYDTSRSTFISKWKSALANSINIGASNGFVHILDAAHVFGFDSYTKPFTLPFKGTPFNFPTLVGSSVLLEAEDYDLGGQGIAYYDLTAGNAGTLYRPADAVDIYSHPASVTNGVSYVAGFNIGGTSAGEWLNYTVNVIEEGDYEIKLRYGNPANTNNIPSSFHYSIDWKDVTGKILAPVTSTATNNFTTWNSVAKTIRFKKGKQSFTFSFDIAPIQLESFVITRIN